MVVGNDNAKTIGSTAYRKDPLYPFAKAVRAFKNKFKIKSSDLESSGNFLTNAILTKVFAAEKYFLRKHRFNVGVSLIMDCEK